MEKGTRIAALALGAWLLLAGSANATVTIDLVWADGGSSTLSIAPNDSTNAGAAADCKGPATGAAQRCMSVVMTMDRNLSAFGVSVSFDTSAVLAADSAIVFKKPLGTAVPYLGDPNVSNGAGTIISFTGVSASGAAAKGTYTIGTILWDASAVTASSIVATFLETGLDGFHLANAAAVPVSELQLNTAALNVIPEPGSASLLGLGLVGLVLAGRRRSR